MSEARGTLLLWGALLIEAPEGILPILGDDDQGYSWEALATLAKHTGISSLENAHRDVLKNFPDAFDLDDDDDD